MKWATETERKQRRAICDTCGNKTGVRCAVCGCFLIALQKLHRCPEGKF